MATATLSVLTHVSGLTVDVEYEDLTNALTALIVTNPQGQSATFSLTVPVIGVTPLDLGLVGTQRVLVSAGAVWHAVINLGGAASLCWPDGWGFEASVD